MRTANWIGVAIVSAGICFGASARAQQAPPQNATQTPAAKPAAAAHHPSARKTEPLVLKTDKEKQSYAIGMSIGKGLHSQPVDVDPTLVARGLRDEMLGHKTLLTDDEAKATLTALQSQVRQKGIEQREALAASNAKEGEAFLAANKSKAGVQALPDGLQYKVLTQGTGPKPVASDTVVCNYRGTLVDGTEFDSSYKRGEPLTIPVSGVIRGWTEALQLMPVGSKWEIYIPASLAYGAEGKGPIGPNETLIFDVELLSIKPKVTPAP
ncbi:MAG TPA: FKBP-type peptidyl-prolyl cis-trans isomerase [Verrucomicrobiae bacterium]|nr:FKBP-type peptidyl-prolyl cis-trans isomerase [Verrucomicrobiae bacterium]